MEQNFLLPGERWEETQITHVAIDEHGNEVRIEEGTNGLIQDTEYSDTPEGN